MMTLLLPNPSRSVDEKRNAVRYIGSMFEVRFFVEAEALVMADAELGRSEISESKLLSAFDALRLSIYKVARKAYSSGRDSYTLTAADFHQDGFRC